METAKVSKKYQVVIVEKIRKETGIKPGDKMMSRFDSWERFRADKRFDFPQVPIMII
jgi:hypothetical protein